MNGDPTDGMKLGTRVHKYLLEPKEYDWQDIEAVKEIATCLRKEVGPAFEFLQHEVSITADFSHDGFTMAYRGRIDSGFLGRILIDYKVLSGALLPAIDRFGYINALSGYCMSTRTPAALILAYNRKTKKCEKFYLDESKFSIEFWEQAVITHGKPVF